MVIEFLFFIYCEEKVIRRNRKENEGSIRGKERKIEKSIKEIFFYVVCFWRKYLFECFILGMIC